MTPVFAWVPGFWEIAIVLAIAALLFGSSLPSLGRMLGKSIIEFKNGISGLGTDEEPTPAARPAVNGSAKR